MASRRFDMLKILGMGKVVIQGRFFPQGGAAIVNSNNVGKGFTVAKTGGAGNYTITFNDLYSGLESAHATVQIAVLTNCNAVFGTYDPVAKTIILQTFVGAAGAAGDLAADPNNSIALYFVFRNTSIVS